MKLNLTTKQIALMAIFAALYYILSLIAPINIPAPGIGNLSISFAALIATVFGIILGPYLGTASALIGTLVTWALTGMLPYNLPFLLCPAFNAFISGSIFYKKWKIAFIAFAVIIVAFVFTPPVLSFNSAQVAIWVLWDKIIALALIIPLVLFRKRLSVGQGAALFFILGFIGNQADNMLGSFVYAWPIVYENIFGFTTEFVQLGFLVSPFAYPAVRLVQAFIVTLIAVPLFKILTDTNWLWKAESIFTPKKAKTELIEERDIIK